MRIKIHKTKHKVKKIQMGIFQSQRRKHEIRWQIVMDENVEKLLFFLKTTKMHSGVKLAFFFFSLSRVFWVFSGFLDFAKNNPFPPRAQRAGKFLRCTSASVASEIFFSQFLGKVQKSHQKVGDPGAV